MFQEQKKPSYKTFLRLMTYVKPYTGRLIIGIVAGLCVGGSLFFSIILIPQLASSLDSSSQIVKPTVAELNRNTEMVMAIANNKNLTKEEQLAEIEKLINPKIVDPQLDAFNKKVQNFITDYKLPAKIEKNTVHVYKPFNFTFNIVDDSGRMAWQILLGYILVFIFLWFIKNVAIYVNRYYTAWVGSRVVNDLRNNIFEKITNQSLAFFGKVDVGQLVSRTTNDTGAIQNAVSTSLEDLSKCPLEILACIAALFVVGKDFDNYSLPIIMFFVMPLLFVPIMILRKKIRKRFHANLQQVALVFQRMLEIFSCIKVVKAYNTEEREVNHFKQVNYTYFRGIINVMKSELLMSPLMEFVAVMAIMAFLIYSYCTNVSVGQIFALLTPAYLMYRPIKDLAKITTIIQKSLTAADRYFEMMDLHMELVEKDNPVVLNDFKKEIALNDIVFSYDEKTIVNHVSFKIPKGHTVAVVGETGSGKSTIANLLARFYDVNDGSIRIDDTDIRDFSIRSLRKHIGVVTQESILFNDTIANNIAYGVPNASLDEIKEAARQANAHEFIVNGNHEKGYDTVVGEKGFKLSGGEKQRVAIARAILQNPPILILDEATSALDTVTERLVQDALNKVMANRTVFVIAHRLSTIKDANTIIVLNKGVIVESGTHQELLAQKGRYFKLHETQFKK